MYGSKILRKKARNVTSENLNVGEYFRHMIGLIESRNYPYVTLQHVKHVKTGFVMKDSNGDYIFYINPKVVSKSNDMLNSKESFISYKDPSIKTEIKRHKEVTISYIDQDFNNREETFSDVKSVHVQQILDLFDGIIPLDYELDIALKNKNRNHLIMGSRNIKKTSSRGATLDSLIGSIPAYTTTFGYTSASSRGTYIREEEVLLPNSSGGMMSEPISEEPIWGTEEARSRTERSEPENDIERQSGGEDEVNL